MGRQAEKNNHCGDYTEEARQLTKEQSEEQEMLRALIAFDFESMDKAQKRPRRVRR
jgi:hypothetical protein